MSIVRPQRSYLTARVTDFTLNKGELDQLCGDYKILWLQTVVKLVPALKFLQPFVGKQHSKYGDLLKDQTEVIPLEVLFLNEQYYGDCAKILQFYAHLIKSLFDEAGIPLPDDFRTMLGGDQLTRERFVGCMMLLINAPNTIDGLKHLGPVTFEYFHMLMALLQLMFDKLYKKDSNDELGTLKSAECRSNTMNINPSVKDSYDSDKEFIKSYVDAHIVEATLEYFGMEDMYSLPTKHVPPCDMEEEHLRKWVDDTFSALVMTSVWPYRTEAGRSHTAGNVSEDGTVFKVCLKNGQVMDIIVPKKPEPIASDAKKNYAHMVLEFGMLFKAWLDLIKQPDRERGIRLLKMTMVIFKSGKNQSKYAYEVVRLLVHQLFVLSEKEAHEQFYAMFVNTKGRVDSHVACDDRMEWQVAAVKKHIKHMYSNKTEVNIATRTRAIAAIADIANVFDQVTNVLKRQKKHKATAGFVTEHRIMDDLRLVRPFKYIPDRHHAHFEHQQASVILDLDVAKFDGWLKGKVYEFATEHNL